MFSKAVNMVTATKAQVACLGLIVFAATPVCAQTRPARSYFEKEIRPVFADKCYGCHSSKLKSPMGGLVLDTKAGLKKGGNGGPVLVPGDPASSRLLQALTYKQTELRMPPTGKLPDEKIAAFEKWIAAGAPDPREETSGNGQCGPHRCKAGHGYRDRPQVVGLPAGGTATAAEIQGRRTRQADGRAKRSMSSSWPGWSRTNFNPRPRRIAPRSSHALRSI